MKIQESGEMYLESILILKEELPQVRSIDVVSHTGYSKPSVSRAMGLLKEDKYIEIDKNGYITLTEKGLNVATKIYERHNVLSKLFISLGVSPETATKDACKIEHNISDETFDALKNHIKQFAKENK